MKKVITRFLTILVFAVTFLTPTIIVKFYSRFVNPMTGYEERMAIMAGTGAMIILAVLTGFSGKKQIAQTLAGKYRNVRAVSNDSIVVKDPGSNAETLFKWNQKEKIWESDHGTYLDMDHMDEWLKQRASDRQWADEQMKNLKNRKTAFDRDIDAMKKKR